MPRARDLGIGIGQGTPGARNAITDVPGVRVGHTTLISGQGDLEVGRGPVRTGVTVILPHGGDPWTEPVFAGCHRLNGNGELTGLEWLRESGTLTSPIALTNTHSVGVVRDALVALSVRERHAGDVRWTLPVVGETWDGLLSDVDGQHVRPEHVEAALGDARDRGSAAAAVEGSVGGGTGTVCHGFKGGIGTASRVVEAAGGCHVGVLVQANHGRRQRLAVCGVPVGLRIPAERVPEPRPETPPGAGSIIAIVATDAPLIPTQCTALAQRAGLGVARAGGLGEHWSGDLFLAFATGNQGLPAVGVGRSGPLTVSITMLANTHLSHLYEAVVEATEEAILNALLAAETMTGRDRVIAHRLPPDLLLEAMETA